jgi:hypothetical protein
MCETNPARKPELCPALLTFHMPASTTHCGAHDPARWVRYGDKKLRIVILGFGTARQKRVLE